MSAGQVPYPNAVCRHFYWKVASTCAGSLHLVCQGCGNVTVGYQAQTLHKGKKP